MYKKYTDEESSELDNIVNYVAGRMSRVDDLDDTIYTYKDRNKNEPYLTQEMYEYALQIAKGMTSTPTQSEIDEVDSGPSTYEMKRHLREHIVDTVESMPLMDLHKVIDFYSEENKRLGSIHLIENYARDQADALDNLSDSDLKLLYANYLLEIEQREEDD